MDKRKKAIIVDGILGAAVAASVISMNWDLETGIWQKLCDGFFVAAVLLLGIGGIRWVNNTGSFDAMGYSIKTTVQTFLPMLQMGHLGEREDFLSYKERKAEERKDPSDLLIVGAVYLALSLVALALYYIV